MNKIATSILAGVALAAIAVAPASAQQVSPNVFTNVGTALPTFSFGPGNATYSLTNASAAFNPGGSGSNPILGTLSLMGSNFVAGSTYQYATTSLVFVPNGGGTTLTETGASSVELFQGSTSFSALGPAGFSGSGNTGDRLNLSYSSTPVPEASTVISFGALLALGGLAVLRRKSVARAS